MPSLAVARVSLLAYEQIGALSLEMLFELRLFGGVLLTCLVPTSLVSMLVRYAVAYVMVNHF
jgi:hypothetical protein